MTYFNYLITGAVVLLLWIQFHEKTRLRYREKLSKSWPATLIFALFYVHIYPLDLLHDAYRIKFKGVKFKDL